MKKKFSLPDLTNAAGPISSIVAILVGLLSGIIILLISNPARALDGFLWIIAGSLMSPKDIGNVLYYATPIIMTGLSVAFAFRTSLFNIGASGQFIMGAYGAVLVGVKLQSLGSFHWIVALLTSIVFGALWALIPGILKAYFNVNEVISFIMTNYIGMYLVNSMVRSTVYHKLTNRSLPVAESANIPKIGFDKIFPGSSVNGGIVIAILISILIYILLNKTTFGFELKACGFNNDASRYAGINAKKNIVISLLIAGALAGMGGGLLYLAGSGKYIYVEDIIAPEGFTGISVALLGMSHPIGTLFAGLFVAYITVGGSYMQLSGFVPEIIDIITAIIIYFAAFSLIIRNVLYKLKTRNAGDKS
ncbi:MAG: ABC transporter permease [Acetivibrionales bacterium]|jgi:simple sugar transport system permease protein